MPNGSALWERAVVWPTYNSQGVKTFYFFSKHHMSQHSRPFWGPPQGAWTRRKAAADGNEAGSVKTAWVGAKGLWGDGPGTDKGSEAWLARRGSSQGRTHSEQLGLGRAPRKQSWCGGQLGLARRG